MSNIYIVACSFDCMQSIEEIVGCYTKLGDAEECVASITESECYRGHYTYNIQILESELE